jgi:hypothetical protein
MTDQQRADTVLSEHPAITPHLERFAYREDDSAINPYITVGLAPYGPAEAYRGAGATLE